MIKCITCQEEKQLNDFYWRTNGKISDHNCKCCKSRKVAINSLIVGKRTLYDKTYRKSVKGRLSRHKYNVEKREQIKKLKNTLTFNEWVQILLNQGNKCNGCSTSFLKTPATEDHIIPMVDGGERTYENIQALCNSCNSIKGARDMKFLKERLAFRKKVLNDKRK